MLVNNQLREVVSKTDQREIYNILGKNVRKKRKEMGMTQTDVGNQLGVTTQQVQKYESGKSAMYVHTLLDLSRILSLTLEDLVSEPVKVEEIIASKKRYFRDSKGEEDEQE